MHLECGNSIKHVAVCLIWDSSHIGSNTVEDLACQSTSYLFPLNRRSSFCGRLCLRHLWRLQNQEAWLIFLLLFCFVQSSTQSRKISILRREHGGTDADSFTSGSPSCVCLMQGLHGADARAQFARDYLLGSG